MINFEAYQAAIQHAAYFLQPNPGFLRLGGSDRIDFMQRQSTNDLRQLSPGHSLLTVLTSPTARILDVLCLIDEGETLGIFRNYKTFFGDDYPARPTGGNCAFFA